MMGLFATDSCLFHLSWLLGKVAAWCLSSLFCVSSWQKPVSPQQEKERSNRTNSPTGKGMVYTVWCISKWFYFYLMIFYFYAHEYPCQIQFLGTIQSLSWKKKPCLHMGICRFYTVLMFFSWYILTLTLEYQPNQFTTDYKISVITAAVTICMT